MEIPLKYKQLWNNWDVRVLILLSLSIQIILIFFGRLRRTSTSRWIQIVVWASYLLADWVADFALGQLSSSMDDSSSNVVIAFWAPFLILHLGGPDTITAYSTEDNELWARHLLGLGYELFVSFYVLFRSLPNTRLLVPTLLIFLVAIIKYVERSYSLYKASVKGIQDSIRIYNITQPTKDLNDLSQTFGLYSCIKSYFIDNLPQHRQFYERKNIVSEMSRKDIIMIMRKSLSYAYDEFYTKAIVNHSILGYVLRALCSTCILLAFSLFLLEPKDDFNDLDVAITYVLLTTSIFLDFMATIMLMFSDRMIVSLLNVKKLSNLSVLLAEYIVRIKNACHKRSYWSIKLPQLNLLINCLSISSPKKTLRQSMMSWVAKKLSFVQEAKTLYKFQGSELEEAYTLHTMRPMLATQEVLEIIISHLKKRMLYSIEELNKPAGFHALQQVRNIVDWAPVVPFVQLFEKFSFYQKVLVWHITTELCFHHNPESQHPTSPHQIEMKVEENSSEEVKRTGSKMEACKYLSNYMMHKVMMQSNILSDMQGQNYIIFQSTVEEMLEFIRESCDGHQLLKPNEKVAEEVCMKMIAAPIEFKYSNDDSMLGLARVLARLMLVLREEERWKVITTAWVELLYKGAKDSMGNIHMKQLSRGDDLLTFVWLCNNFFEPGDLYDVLLQYLSVQDVQPTIEHLVHEIELRLKDRTFY